MCYCLTVRAFPPLHSVCRATAHYHYLPQLIYYSTQHLFPLRDIALKAFISVPFPISPWAPCLPIDKPRALNMSLAWRTYVCFPRRHVQGWLWSHRPWLFLTSDVSGGEAYPSPPTQCAVLATSILYPPASPTSSPGSGSLTNMPHTYLKQNHMVVLVFRQAFVPNGYV